MLTTTNVVRAGVGLAVVVAFLVGLWLLRSPTIERSEDALALIGAPSTSGTKHADAIETVPDVIAPAACREQSIEVISGDEPVVTRCMSQTRATQNGSVRTYRVQGQEPADSSLRIDAAGATILRADLVDAHGGLFTCGRGECAGISLSAHDAQGVRTLRLDRAKLTRTLDNQFMLVSGLLRTVPDDALAGTSCTGQLLYITVGDSTQHFCPDGGSGFDLQNDGAIAYGFMNGDGDTLSVQMRPEGGVQAVEYRSFGCRSQGCGGVSVTPGAPDGSRNFIFQGTTLTDHATGTRLATLNGNVLLAAQ